MTKFVKGVERPPGRTVEMEMNSTPLSFVRMFGPDGPTSIAANQWTPIVLDPAGEVWLQFGEKCWEPILPGDPDYFEFPAGVRCLKEGVYGFAGGVIFDSANQTGDRAVDVTEAKGPYANRWNLVASQPMPKVSDAGLIVSGEAYQYVGNIVELRASSTVATVTITNPQSEWLSAVLLHAA